MENFTTFSEYKYERPDMDALNTLIHEATDDLNII